MLSWQYLNPRNDSLDSNEVKWGGYMKFLSSQIDMCFIEFQKKSQKWLGFKNLQSKVRHLGMSASISHHILSRLTSDMFFTVQQHLSCLCHVVYELPWAIHLNSCSFSRDSRQADEVLLHHWNLDLHWSESVHCGHYITWSYQLWKLEFQNFKVFKETIYPKIEQLGL